MQSSASSLTRATRAAIKKYGILTCQTAFASYQAGNGANTIAQTTRGLTNTTSADAAINAGRELAKNSE